MKVGRASREKKNRTSQQHSERVSAKLSERLIALIQPYRDDDLTREAYEILLAVASISWNLDVLPASQGQELVERAMEGIPEMDRPVARRMIAECLLRKRELFPEDRRFVAKTTVTDTGDAFNVQVASIANR